MSPRIIAAVLSVTAFQLICGCTGPKEAVKTYRFRFAEELSSRSSATVMKKKESYTTIEFLSVPAGASVYVYEKAKNKRGIHLGKTPLNYKVMTYYITEYSDMSAEYTVDINIAHEVTCEIDYSDPAYTAGEVTFCFAFEKKGYRSKIDSIAIPATNEMLIRALIDYPMPEYKVEATLEKL